MRIRPRMMPVFLCVVLLSGCTAATYYPPPGPGPGPEGLLRPGDLRVRDLDMSPDPAREGTRVRFRVTLINLAGYGGRVNLSVRDMDEIVAEAFDIYVRPRENVIEFPYTGYRFSRAEHCFTVAVDLEGTWRPIDLDRRFCAQKVPGGWSLAGRPVPPGPPPVPPAPPPAYGPFFVEDLDMAPDPARPQQEIRFRVMLRNEGVPARADILIRDRDEIIARMENFRLPRGVSEIKFPFTRYAFQQTDHCFTVALDIDRTRHRVDARRTFCARKAGPGLWSLRP